MSVLTTYVQHYTAAFTSGIMPEKEINDTQIGMGGKKTIFIFRQHDCLHRTNYCISVC